MAKRLAAAEDWARLDREVREGKGRRAPRHIRIFRIHRLSFVLLQASAIIALMVLVVLAVAGCAKREQVAAGDTMTFDAYERRFDPPPAYRPPPSDGRGYYPEHENYTPRQERTWQDQYQPDAPPRYGE